MILSTNSRLMMIKKFCWLIIFLFFLGGVGCEDQDIVEPTPVVPPVKKDTTTLDNGPIDFSVLNDTYGEMADANLAFQWRHYNSHDLSVINDEKFYYSYSTDVCYGCEIRPGIQIRRSINLVEWEFVGWAFSSIPTQGANYIIKNGGEPFSSLWAPYIIKVGDEYRLYYSLSSAIPRLSCIGLAVSSDPRGPFREKGLVVTSTDDNTTQTNAIDPTVIIDNAGKHWMYYGSSWDGIYRLEINAETGLALRNKDGGIRVAHRGFTNGKMNGNIEGPEIIYNPQFNMYYLFIAYDWLETKYNVRVGRSKNPYGPFYDINGKDVNTFEDNLPMILAPYKFNGHSGWQGVSHPAVFQNDNDHYFMAHQGRPGVNHYFMVLHVRQMFWTEDGWPIVSPQRFANEDETTVAEEEVAGKWERIYFDYKVVPGFASEQLMPDMQASVEIILYPEGTINGSSENMWTYNAPWLTMSWNNNSTVEKVRVERGRDWENDIPSTLLFTGFDGDFTTIWGKKIE